MTIPIISLIDRYDNVLIEEWSGAEPLQVNLSHVGYWPRLGQGSFNSENKFTGFIFGKNLENNETGIFVFENGNCVT